MSKKKIELQAVNAIGLGKGENIAPGELFKIEKDEGERLLAVGAARIPVPEQALEAKGPAPLTLETLRKDYPDLVEQIEEQARDGYVSKEVASQDFDKLQKELDEVTAALEKAREAQK